MILAVQCSPPIIFSKMWAHNPVLRCPQDQSCRSITLWCGTISSKIPVRSRCVTADRLPPSQRRMHTPFHANPTLADVERPYIDEGTGHSQGQSVTDLYIAKYPLEKQIEYNSKLFNLNSTPAITKDDTKNMSKEEVANLLMELIEK